MGIFFRKGLNVGPVRFNLSLSGIGISAGVRGLRADINARGNHYVICGRYGVYFRRYLSRNVEIPEHSIETGGHWIAVLVIVFVFGFIAAKLIG